MQVQAAEQLVAKKCKPCEGGVEACPLEEARIQLSKLSGWYLTHDGQRIRKDWTVKNFMAGMDFFNRVAQVAEARRASPGSALGGLSQRLDRTLDARHRRAERERFHPGGQDRPTASQNEESVERIL